LHSLTITRPVAAWLVITGLATVLAAAGNPPDRSVLGHATDLYQRTDYDASLQALAADPMPGAEALSLRGKNYFMLGDFKKAGDAFEQAVAADPANAEYALWLGRAYGRRAETGGWIEAPFHASKARQYMEKSVALGPHYHEALNDLFEYYLEAPGFLGGGLDKAEAIARRIGEESPAEYHFAEARMAEKRKDYAAAESEFRRATQAAPREVGRVIDLAAFLARRDRMEESETVFAHAQKVAPDDPRLDFARAKVYVEHKRSLGEARQLLKKYLDASVTPGDPPKAAAELLLKQAQGS
jgi:Flp pilus assembly protein TadD